MIVKNFNKFYFVLVLILFTFNSCKKKSSINNSSEEKNLFSAFSEKNDIVFKKNKNFTEDYFKKYKKNVFFLRQLNIKLQKLDLKNDSIKYRQLNNFILKNAINLKDTLLLAESYRFLGRFYQRYEVFDSAYYQYKNALNYYIILDSSLVVSKMYYSMAQMKAFNYDNIGAESLIYKSIENNKNGNLNKKSLSLSYNLLGLINIDNQEYKKAIINFQKSNSYIDLNNYEEISNLLNNTGLAYQEMGKQDSAIFYFNKGLAFDSLKEKMPESYARFIDNKAYSLFLKKDTFNIGKQFITAHKLRDSLGDKSGLLISEIHLAEYYHSLQNTKTATKYILHAQQLAKQLKNGRDYLKTLELRAKIDTSNSHKQLQEYIVYNDSLQRANFQTQNKFARIDFETDQYINKSNTLSKQNILLITVGSAIIFILFLIYLWRVQKHKTEKLKLELEQQNSNEQLYQLSLRQQKRIEKEKNEERKRISEDLHDGVLGKLFGLRLNLDFFGSELSGNSKIEFQNKIDELQTIEKEIREVSHQLNSNLQNHEIDFINFISEMLKEKSKHLDISNKLKVDNYLWDSMNTNYKINLYKIIQEAVQNSIKHSSAKNILVNFEKQDKQLLIQIIDDGKGFEIKSKHKGIGLKNMKSRVKKMGGNLKIDSTIAKGTCISIFLPL